MSDLNQLPGIGKTFVRDFARIGITHQSQLRGADAQALFDQLCEANARALHATSRNYLYVIRMAIYAAEGGSDPDLLRWNAWTDPRVRVREARCPSRLTSENNKSAIPPTNSVQVTTRAQWRAWLARHHATSTGVWLITFKKATGRSKIDYAGSVEEALCFGWIDSKPGKVDDERTMLYFAPRKPRSGWSKPNKERVERLIATGLMHPAGLTKVEQAKLDGSWSKLDAVEALTLPPDLEAALQAHPPAMTHFQAFPRSTKRGILEWISSAKRAETRTRRINETAQLASQNIRANQWP
jgi:uncharacterized protein YdeI (YjbR/CyaY-like superfamily)